MCVCVNVCICVYVCVCVCVIQYFLKKQDIVFSEFFP